MCRFVGRGDCVCLFLGRGVMRGVSSQDKCDIDFFPLLMIRLFYECGKFRMAFDVLFTYFESSL